MSAPAESPARRRGCLRSVLLFGAFVAVVGLLTLGALIHYRAALPLNLLGIWQYTPFNVAFDDLRVYPRHATAAHLEAEGRKHPLRPKELVADDLRVAWRWQGTTPKLREVIAGQTALHIDLARLSYYARMIDQRNKTALGAWWQFLPERTDIAPLDLTVGHSDYYLLTMNDQQFTANAPGDGTTFDLALRPIDQDDGLYLTLGFAGSTALPQSLMARGALQNAEGDQLTIGKLQATNEDELFAIDAEDLRLTLAPETLAQALSNTSTPLSFDALRIETLSGTIGLDDPLASLRVDALQGSMDRLQLGDADAPTFLGDIDFNADEFRPGAYPFRAQLELSDATVPNPLAPGTRQGFTGTATLSAEAAEKPLQLAWEFAAAEDAGMVIAGTAMSRLPAQEFVARPPGEWLAQVQADTSLRGVPGALLGDAVAALTEYEMSTPLRGAVWSAEATILPQPDAVALNASVKAGSVADAKLAGVLLQAPERRFEGEVALELAGAGKIAGRDTVWIGPEVKGDFTLRDVRPGAWVSLLAKSDAADTLETQASGTVRLSASAGKWLADFNLQLAHFRYPALAQPVAGPITLKGGLGARDDGYQLRNLKIALPGEATATLDGRVRTGKSAGFTGTLKATLPLETVGPIAGLAEAYGTLTVEGQATLAAGAMRAGPIALSGRNLGYGNFATPYGRELKASAKEASWREGALALDGAAVHIEPATELRFDTLRYARDANGGTITALAAESDLLPAVSLGWLDAVEGGQLTTAGDLAWTADGLGRLALPSLNLAAASLTAPGGMAVFTNLALRGGLSYAADTLDAQGTLAAERMLAGGAQVQSLQATLGSEGEYLLLREGTVQLFGGAVRFSARLAPFAEGRPITIEAEADSLDLAQFTEQIKPPRVQLGGHASGTVSLTYAAGEITAFDARLEAGSDFTLNRDMAEEILMSQDLGAVTGGKTMQEIVLQVLGEKAQRPFDSALLAAQLEHGQVVGTVLLDSPALAVTVDINADPLVLAEALRQRQQQRVDAGVP